MKTRYTYPQINSRLITLAIALVFSLSVFGSETEIPKTSSSKASSTEIVIEQDLQVEDWMLNLDTWELNNNIDIAVEEELQIEDWMLSAEAFSAEAVNLDTEDTEAEMEIETWMTDLNQW